ncbi:unnamed protein product [Rotaria sordida]|uniref:G-protein coupled receptors family 1 profile domain-containing protein n=1 Tax=Rotaria sordida TaxID=392033 RepID=A0A814KRP5_9BILA|nr:unnamed protein product [Rotaria sordida]CAF1494756.1 unnamed protein product [Rotaria sordida]
MNASSQSTIEYLNFIRYQLNRYIPITLLILGSIGNILNILVFTRPLIRTNPCSIYFVNGSIVNFISLYIGLITPFLGTYNLDPTQIFKNLCKIRYYLRFSTITLSTWFILLACIDRLFSTSNNVNIRSWSSVRLAKRIVITAIIICFICPYTQVFYCYTISQGTLCTWENQTCKLLNDIILLICNSGFPPILMILISILTIRNVKYLNHTVDGSHRRRRRRDVQLIRLLLIQVFSFILYGIPITAQKIYSCSTIFMIKSPLTIAIDNLINQVSTEISYINNSTIFYTYSLTSKKYRKEVFRILSSLFTRCQNIKIHPIQSIDSARINQNKIIKNIPNESYELNIRNRTEIL